jgi:predicted metal-dependent hydrolase
MVRYTLIRSSRKTVELRILNDTTIQVRAPLKMPKYKIDAFVRSREDWIRTHLATAQKRSEDKQASQLNFGATLPLRGKEYPIVPAAGDRAVFDGERFGFPADSSPEVMREAASQLYRLFAKRYLPVLVNDFARRMGVTPTAVKINGARTRWGSCSAQKSINFSWRLMLADDETIAYVVVHELAHLTEMNHSARFWAIVEGMLPNYRVCKERLRHVQARLLALGWE